MRNTTKCKLWLIGDIFFSLIGLALIVSLVAAVTHLLKIHVDSKAIRIVCLLPLLPLFCYIAGILVAARDELFYGKY